jgi:CBS domain-containing protein
MKTAEVMTRKVLTVGPDDTLSDAIQLMLQNRVSGLPVVGSQGELIGMLTEGDLLRRAESHTERQRPRWLEFLVGPGKLADEYVHTHSRRVGDVMTSGVMTAAPNTPLEDVVSMMEKHRIKRLPVLDDGRLVGIVSRANLLQALAIIAHDIPEAAPTDEQIRAQLWDELQKFDWTPRAFLNIVVRDSVVHLYGSVTDGRESYALKVAAQNIPGVKSVCSYLVWCDPVSGSVIELSGEENTAKRE